MEFSDFFIRAAGFPPYPYQQRLGIVDEAPLLAKIPTGAGKTEAAVLRWLYRKLAHPDQAIRNKTPTRLVYCLPMRTLVEQTAERANGWLGKLGAEKEVGTTVLMGGQSHRQWYLYPEKPHIIVGTQDMLLSRALNRGYGNSPFAWPVEYGLLNNDCCWIMDEVQLMANGLSTSTQLAGLRRKLGTYGVSTSLWMSATAKAEWLDSVDHPGPAPEAVLELGDADLTSESLSRRRNACKILREIKPRKGRNYARDIATTVAERHLPGTLTLVILNTVGRAQQVYQALTAKGRRMILPDAEKILVHSRFRASDRKEKQRSVMTEAPSGGRIVVATQAVEAGVDLSARTLVTELAPWSSLVQRFGRCNRYGEFEQADVFWVDVGERSGDIAPYQVEEMEKARRTARSHDGQSVAPSQLEQMDDLASVIGSGAILRRRDVTSLFDTTPDLSGNYLDVSHYVRGEDARTVSVFWRQIPENGPQADAKTPDHSEIVSVSLGDKGIRGYLKDGRRKAWAKDYLNDQWRQVGEQEICPGMTLMLDAAQGWYSSELGWNADSTGPTPIVDMNDEDDDDQSAGDYQGSDPWSTNRPRWVTLSDHSCHVETATAQILYAQQEMIADPEVRKAALTAGLCHDVGKAHPVFQAMLRDQPPKDADVPAEDVQMAKSPGKGKSERRHFRHELGSAITILQHADWLSGRYRDLAAYLAAAHHGKVRLGIRSLPRRQLDADVRPEADLLLGYNITQPENLPQVELGADWRLPETELDMSIAMIGLNKTGRSWLERNLALLEWLGPFRLAYLEAIIRAADMRASRAEKTGSAEEIANDCEHHNAAAHPRLPRLL